MATTAAKLDLEGDYGNTGPRIKLAHNDTQQPPVIPSKKLELIYALDLPLQAKALLLYYRGRAGNGGVLFESVGLTAEKMNTSIPTIERWRRLLKEKGHLVPTGEVFGNNRRKYWVTIPGLQHADHGTPKYTADFERLWSEWPAHRGSSKPRGFEAYHANLRTGYTIDQMLHATWEYIEDWRDNDAEDRFLMAFEKFFGLEERWKEYL